MELNYILEDNKQICYGFIETNVGNSSNSLWIST